MSFLKFFPLICSFFLFCLFNIPLFVNAQEVLNEIQEEIKEKQSHIDQIDRKINEYQDRIEQKQQEQISLKNQMELLENHMAKTALEKERTQEEMQKTHARLRLFDEEIQKKETQLAKQQDMLVSVLHHIRMRDQDSVLQIFFGANSFSEIFDEFYSLKRMDMELQKSLDGVKQAKEQLFVEREQEQVALRSLQDLEKQLLQKERQWEEEKKSKDFLYVQSAQSEAVFSDLLRELRQEQQFIDQQIVYLQEELEQRLSEQDEQQENLSVLTWPFYPEKGISATFHDPTYPFRYLFEHSGIDLPAPTGTPVAAAAPGYVAWARQGSMYGNYVMVIHTNGLATLYAHLSHISVSPDQFISRGDTIGLVGSTGFSTGPHLHFEVRKNGIPTDPMNYLP